jgi:hypothetical protein
VAAILDAISFLVQALVVLLDVVSLSLLLALISLSVALYVQV